MAPALGLMVARAFNCRLGFEWATPEGRAVVEGVLLPDWQIQGIHEADHWFRLDNHLCLWDGEQSLGPSADPRLRLQQQVQMCLTAEAREFLFIHAGVVAIDGQAWVIPGPSRAGKSTLVLELVRSGADFLSDEFAVLDRQGLVHAYPRPLWERLSKTRKRCWTAPELGWQPGPPLPLGALLMTRYVAGANWRPRELNVDEALEEIWKEVRYPSAREGARKWLSGALQGVRRWKGVRGEAAELSRKDSGA